MQSNIIALLAPEGSREATLLVRRADGQFALSRIDARVAKATQVAACYAAMPMPGPSPLEVSAAQVPMPHWSSRNAYSMAISR